MTRRARTPAPPAAVRKVKAALARWKAVAPELARRGAVDVVRLETYCMVWARWQEAEQKLNESGSLIRDNTTGRVGKNPLFAAARESRQTLTDLEAKLAIGESAPAAEPEAPSDRVTRRELADRLGVHMQTITKWEREGMPIARRGRKGKPSEYSESAVRAWKLQRESVAQAGPGALDVIRERARKERAQAALAEQMHAVRSGRLLDVDEAEKRWATEIAAARSLILASYTMAADRVFAAATTQGLAGVERELKAVAYEVLRELAKDARAVVAPVEVPA
jgi:phage terminase small subunit